MRHRVFAAGGAVLALAFWERPKHLPLHRTPTIDSQGLPKRGATVKRMSWI